MNGAVLGEIISVGTETFAVLFTEPKLYTIGAILVSVTSGTCLWGAKIEYTLNSQGNE